MEVVRMEVGMETSVFVKESMLQAMYDWKYRWEREISNGIKRMAEADRVEEVMFYLQYILRDTLYMPMNETTCYFCIIHDSKCSKCEYAKYHGECITPNSDYWKIMEKRDNLLDAIDNFYKGEVYGLDLNKEVQSKLVKNLVQWFFAVNCSVNECIKYMELSNTVESIMIFKQKLLITLVRNLPIGYQYNYFCLENKDCRNCEYAKIHGVCNEEGSDVNKIEGAMKDLLFKLEDYYKGESFE